MISQLQETLNTQNIPIILIKSVLFSILVFVLRVSVSLCVVIAKDSV